jgi:DNA-binding beta-propeller fold protein YncE
VYTTPFGLGPAVATRFDSTGVVTQTFTLNAPILSGIDADTAGNVYIATYSSGTIEKFTPDGIFLNSTVIGGHVDDIAIDEVGQRLFVAREFGAGVGIKVFDIAGPEPVFMHDITTPVQSMAVGIHFAAESGNILVTDFGGISLDPRGLEYSPAGVLLAEYRPAGAGVAWDITTFVVPEPSSAALLLVGSLGFALRRRTIRR